MHEQTHGPLETVPVASLTFAGGQIACYRAQMGFVYKGGILLHGYAGEMGVSLHHVKRRGGFLA